MESTVLTAEVTFYEPVEAFFADFYVPIAQLAVILRVDEKGLGEADFMCVLFLVALPWEMEDVQCAARNVLCFS